MRQVETRRNAPIAQAIEQGIEWRIFPADFVDYFGDGPIDIVIESDNQTQRVAQQDTIIDMLTRTCSLARQFLHSDGAVNYSKVQGMLLRSNTGEFKDKEIKDFK